MNNKKVLIIHDRFQYRGGGERLILTMAKALSADIATEYWGEDSFLRDEAPQQLFVLDEGEPPAIVWRYFRAHFNFYFKTKKFIKDYDIVIFSGNNCLTASFNLPKKVPKIFYCHTPVRYVYDLLKLRREEEKNFLKKFIYYDIGKWFIRTVYNLGLNRMNRVISNSKNVQSRLEKFCIIKSEVIYPPIDTHKFQWLGQGDYYLSFARLDPLKRIDDIIRAFQQMPDKKLIISSGGIELDQLKKLAQGFDNISILGWVDDSKLVDLVGNAIASIYIPIDEDAGMTQIESMSAGKPCVVVDDGGLPESIIDGKTGIIIPKNYEISDIINAVERLIPDVASGMKDDCVNRAEEFSKEIFIEKIKAIVYEDRN